MGQSNASFTIRHNQAPYAPSSLTPGNTLSSSPTLIGTLTPTLQWTFSDPDSGNTQSAYQVIIKDMADGGVYDSSWVTSSSNSITIPSNKLTRGTTYKWTVATKDNSGAQSPASATHYVRTNSLPETMITSYTNGETLTDNILSFTWSYSDADSQPQTHYQLVGSKDNWASVAYDSGEIPSAATSHSFIPSTTGQWDFRLRVKDGMEWSAWSYRNDLNMEHSFEENDEASEAFPIAYQTTYTTVISSATDLDWYKYTPTSSGIDRVTLTVPTGKNYDVFVFDSTMKQIAAGSNGTGVNENIIFEVNAGQVYYIEVVGVGGQFSTLTYGLTVNKLSISSTTTYQYDSNGNITGKTTVTTRQ